MGTQPRFAGTRLRATLIAAACALAVLVLPAPRAAVAATLPAGFTESQIASGMSSPTASAFAPDGRLFVTEQTGSLRVIKNDTLMATSFVTLTVDSSGERGLLGVAFDPNFTANHFVYLYYTSPTPSVHNRLSRFTANGDVATAGSELVLLDLPNLSSATNHNGGAIHFGPDGKLYVAVGENANGANAQSMTTLLGKMLRINSDGSIPTDNPFYNTATGISRLIWAMGVRNPFTFAFQPGTGRMVINDVGQSTWEEIDDGIPGSNYGWPNTEGTTTNPAYRSPLFVYGHGSTSTTGCAITGGVFYNPVAQQFPSSYAGKYFFADYCGGWIRLFDPATGTAAGFASGIGAPVDLQVSADGGLYYLYRGSGAVNRIRYTASNAPAITQQPANLTVTAGQSAAFTCAASGAAPLVYEWQRNNANIGGATSNSYSLASTVPGDNGAMFRCVVTNGFGMATSNNASLTVTANAAPAGTITLPVAGATYAAGNTIAYAGSGTDAEDGMLPATAFTWQIDFHHDTHVHPFMPATTGATSGSFVIPTSGETSANVWYRVTLTVRDSNGLTNVTHRDVQPRTATIVVATIRSGLQVTIDGQPQTAPYSVLSVVGIVRAIGVTSPQTMTGAPWTFASWSDGGAATHNITTPTTNTTYTAAFTPQIGVPTNESITPLTPPLASSERVSPIGSNAHPGAPSQYVAPTAVSVGEILGPPQPAAQNALLESRVMTRLASMRVSRVRRFWWDGTVSGAFSRMHGLFRW